MNVKRGSGVTSTALLSSYKMHGKFIYVVPNHCFIEYGKRLAHHLGIPEGNIKFVTPHFINYLMYKGYRDPIIFDHATEFIPSSVHILLDVQSHNHRIMNIPKEFAE